MGERLVVACVQVSAGPELGPNLELAEELIYRAHAAGARLIALPENVAAMVHGRERVLARACPEASHPGLARFQTVARETGTWLVVGSLHIRLDEQRVANRSFLVAPDGTVAARYDKIHMFDVDLAGGERYRESATFRPGEQAVTAATPWATLGLSICYDVRFPLLYRRLAQAGAAILTVPAAFTAQTGRAHWHTLLRARAIENGCFVIAPAQCGEHDAGRRTFGHSLIVDPWGEVLADGGEQPGVITAELDLERVAEVRGMIPSLRHDRPFSGP